MDKKENQRVALTKRLIQESLLRPSAGRASSNFHPGAVRRRGR